MYKHGRHDFGKLKRELCTKSNAKRFSGLVVKTLRCGRRIPGSNPGLGQRNKTQFFKGTMLCLFCVLSYIIPLLLLFVTTGDLNMGADGAMVVMGAATAGATLLFFLFLRGAATPLFFFFNLLPCRTRLQYFS